ncbi:hypothetical protein POM88_026801 [Heracleum sosnowskyi]|uniref:Uncharacterized protein n=1 Tax=Heracleum sosnowskyi TaxID=360622 RepID=A0AAD8MPA9_9APIA|nr:hypothetical protein POM88_026801 [Heracleum sosnowskyi]
MASSSFMNKQTVISGVTFATNNFVAILSHQELPNEFHIIQDFLASSPLKFALTELASVSFKSVMQVWNSVTFDKRHSDSILMSFEYDGITHYVTPAIVEDALHLPVLGDAVPDNVPDSTLFEFVTKLGYNGEVKRYDNLFRTKLKREWNFFFDTISRCFLNKTSNFDSLPSGSLKIGYSLIHSTVFDYGSFILKALSDRKSDKLGFVCFLRFLKLIFNHLCPNVVFENDVVLPICRITENNIKSLVNSDKANGFIGNAFIPDEVRFFLHQKMPTCYGLLSNAMGQDQSHLVPNPSIYPKQSTTTSTVSQKTLVVRSKKSARTDVSGRQSGSNDFSSTPLIKKKLQWGVQGVLVKKAAKGVEVVSAKRKLVLRDKTDSEDDLPISSIMNVNKEVADTVIEAVVPLSTPQKKRKLSQGRYHIPYDKKQDTDVHDTSILNEQSNSAAQANPDVSIPDAAPSQVVTISDSPAHDSPTKRHVDISWEKYGAAASNLGIKHPMEKLRKAGELVFSRQKKLKGSRPQEPGPQSGSAALTDDPATQEPLNQSLGAGLAIGMVTQEPSSQSEDAGQATVSEKFPDNAQGISGADEVQRLVKDTVNEGSTQEPPILIQPLRSRPMDHPITDSQDKLKSIAIPDHEVTHDTDDDDSDDSDDDNNEKKEQLARALKSSLGTNFGSSSTLMAGKASTGKDFRQDFSVPSEIDPAEQLKLQQWETDWYKSHDSVSYPYALDHAYNTAKLIQNEDLKNHLKATTLLSKSLKHEIDSVKDSTVKVRTDISHSFTKVPTALQLRVVESQVKSIIAEQSSINNRIDSLDTKVTDIQTSLALILNILSNTDVKKGEKVSQTKCTPDLVLRNNDDNTGNDGGDKILQGETSDAAVMKSTIQTSQSQTTQSTHVSDSGVKTVRTLVQSHILTEEQILTDDQILMPGHVQTLSRISEGDEDVIIDNPEDASNLFQKFTTKDDIIVTLYHTDKRVQQLFARKALSTASEEYPDLSHE